MVIDSSALIAILFEEAEQAEYSAAIEGGTPRLLSAVNAFETALVVESRKGAHGGRELDLLLHRAKVDIVPFNAEHFEAARAAWRRYGKGNHPAGLNLSDCCAYALARTSGEPLLYKGGDFRKTDISSALPSPGLPKFEIGLASAFYQQGFFNVPAMYDGDWFGGDGSRIEVYVVNIDQPSIGVVNRTARRDRRPRILRCHTALKAHFHEFDVGDTINVEVLGYNRIRVWCSR